MIKRITTTEAARRLSITPDIVRGYARIGWLSRSTSSGRSGRGKRMYFDAAEVEAFARGGAPAAKAYREQQANGAPKPRRYHKARA